MKTISILLFILFVSLTNLFAQDTCFIAIDAPIREKAKDKVKPMATLPENTLVLAYKKKGAFIFVETIGNSQKFKGYVRKSIVKKKNFLSNKLKNDKARIVDYNPSKSGTSREIHTGPRGGKYYINKNGNKTYVKKKSN